MSQWEGQIGLFHPAGGGPCYQCLFPEPPAPELMPACAQAGIVGALPGVMGAMMALEAIKLVTGAGTPLRGALHDLRRAPRRHPPHPHPRRAPTARSATAPADEARRPA